MGVNYEDFDNIEKNIERIKDSMRQQLIEASPEKRIEMLNTMDNDGLQWICDDVAMPKENYEICHAAKLVLESRGKKLG